MKKLIGFLLFCIILTASALSFAEQHPEEAVFSDFAVAFDAVRRDGDRFMIRLFAYFESEADALRLNFSLKPQETLGGAHRYLTPEETTRFFTCGNRIYATEAGGFRHMTPEEMEKTNALPCRTNALVAFKTPSGEDFLQNSSWSSFDFGMFDLPEKQKDGRWRRAVLFESADFSTGEEEILLEFSLLDPHADAPYTGEVEQVIYITIP